VPCAITWGLLRMTQWVPTMVRRQRSEAEGFGASSCSAVETNESRVGASTCTGCRCDGFALAYSPGTDRPAIDG
jgi:hypothetical protein